MWVGMNVPLSSKIVLLDNVTSNSVFVAGINHLRAHVETKERN